MTAQSVLIGLKFVLPYVAHRLIYLKFFSIVYCYLFKV